MTALLTKASIVGVLLAASASAIAQTEPAAAPSLETIAAPSDPVSTPAIDPAATTPAATTEDTVLSAEEERIRAEEESFADAASQKERDARNGLGVAARLSTLGFGVELIKSVHKRVNLRAQGNFFDISKSIEEDGVDYDGKLKLKTLGLLADFHPFAGGFRITAGGYSNGNKVGLNAACKSECEVGDLTISDDPNSTDDARLFGGIKFKSFSPYVGLGFGNALRGWPVHFGIDLGVLIQGSPKVSLGAAGSAVVTDENGNTTTENLGSNQEVQDALREEEANAEDSSKEFKYYPVINFTLGYRFSL